MARSSLVREVLDDLGHLSEMDIRDVATEAATEAVEGTTDDLQGAIDTNEDDISSLRFDLQDQEEWVSICSKDIEVLQQDVQDMHGRFKALGNTLDAFILEVWNEKRNLQMQLDDAFELIELNNRPLVVKVWHWVVDRIKRLPSLPDKTTK
jgi:predicted  nucleic acid-binding Zn-ribbon protein